MSKFAVCWTVLMLLLVVATSLVYSTRPKFGVQLTEEDADQYDALPEKVKPLITDNNSRLQLTIRSRIAKIAQHSRPTSPSSAAWESRASYRTLRYDRRV